MAKASTNRLTCVSTSSARAAGRDRSSSDAIRRTYLLSRESGGLLLRVPFERKLDESVDQLRHGQPAVLPHLRVHADGGESGNGIDLVDVEAAGRRFEQEVDARHTAALHGEIAFHRQSTEIVGLLGRDAGGQLDLGLVQQVLVFVIVELARLEDFS